MSFFASILASPRNGTRFEAHETGESALQRERQLKRRNRAWKLELIERGNRASNDLADELTL